MLGGITDLAAYKQPCAVATLVDMTNTMTGLPVIDGYQLLANDRVCVRANTNQITNGIMNSQLGAWTRAIDFAFNSGVVTGTQVLINNGATFANVVLRVTTLDPIVVGSSLITFSTYIPGPAAAPIRAPFRQVTSGTVISGHIDNATSADGAIEWLVFYAGTKVQNIPAPGSVPAGQQLTIIDGFGDCTVNPIVITPASGFVNRVASVSMGGLPGSAPYMSLTLQSDGNVNWVLI